MKLLMTQFSNHYTAKSMSVSNNESPGWLPIPVHYVY